MTTTTTKQPRRMAREPQTGDIPPNPPVAKQPSKLAMVEALLLAPPGASIAELMAATGWQQHSVRGAMAGALKQRGLMITSDKVDGLRRYAASKPA